MPLPSVLPEKSESKSRRQVHIVHPPPDEAMSHLQELLDPVIDVSTGPQITPTTEVLVHGRPTRDQLASCSRLRALIVPYAGIPAETRKLLLSYHPELPIYNLHHNAAAAAELALALFLAAAKTLVPVDRTFRNHDWRSRYDGAPTILLEGKTAVVLGFGAIGSRVAKACQALGMEVHAVRRHAERMATDTIRMHSIGDLRMLLPEADALFVCLPLTPETEGLLGADEIALLPPGCVLVNIARGSIIDEQALYHALEEQQIAAAGIDVWYNYPKSTEGRASTPPSQFPFHELENVVMSPHRGGAFRLEELEQQRMSDLARTLNAIHRGRKAPHRVNLLEGY